MAFAPMGVFFSAIYTESLFLALSVGLFWFARRGQWAWVGVTGAAAVATRSTGIVLILPALSPRLYGPREVRPPERPPGRGEAGCGGGAATSLSSSRRRALAAPAPGGDRGAFLGGLALAGGEALSPFKAEHRIWAREFVGPLVSVWRALHHPHLSLLFLIAAIPAAIGVCAPAAAYGVYVVVAMAVACSDPVKGQDALTSYPPPTRPLPLVMWLGAWLSERPRLQIPALVCSAAAMCVFVERFATWHWAS